MRHVVKEEREEAEAEREAHGADAAAEARGVRAGESLGAVGRRCG